jgi:hypothetical protein
MEQSPQAQEISDRLSNVVTLRRKFLNNNYETLEEVIQKHKEKKDNKIEESIKTARLMPEFNRCFYNYINAYYSLEEARKNLEKSIEKNTEYNPEFASKKEKFGLKNNEYLFFALRNYYTHDKTLSFPSIELFGYPTETLDPGKQFVLEKNEDFTQDCKDKDFYKALEYLERFDKHIPIEKELEKFNNFVNGFYNHLEEKSREILFEVRD